MRKKYVLSIDQSTQGTKALLFDKNGDIVCRADLPHKQYINEKGWVSHDLEEIYKNTILVVKNLIEKAGIKKEQIACLGISNQRETSAAWDRETGEPLAKAIVWQCSRAENICEKVKEMGVSEKVLEKTGMPLSPYFPAAKYAWLQENVESIKRKREEGSLCFGTIDTWLLYKLTKGKVYATDYSNASRTQLYNIHDLEWDAEICNWFNIDKTALPEVKDSSHHYGDTGFEGLFDTPIPICSIIGDSQGALFGQACIEAGMVKATYGTGSSVMMNIGEKAIQSRFGLVTSLAWGLDGKVYYVLEGNINYTGAVITWLKNEIDLIKSAGETQELAYEANKNDKTYLVPAFSGLGAPYWKSDATAMITGMSRTTGRKEIVKAALESIAYQITDVVKSMESDKEIKVKELCVDGAPTANQYLMKFQCDILNTTVKLPRCEESSAQGAGYMAGICNGFYEKEKLFVETKRNKFVPSISKEEREEKYMGWKIVVEKVIR
ncbi:glycerol kinase GlpK [Clostridium sp. SHJSY1]|uniref:FGGY-family carbohydrate kinase n=1 Tax=Clostridium sp. SHJSY1 TaxID=2942483 RepID=UPI002876DFE7|nr:glycerol kinase [Clostridium sp. SHJSY1]MDS0525813.1 glycerol kinase GlpK [Clostridium sp. SHJSY1]